MFAAAIPVARLLRNTDPNRAVPVMYPVQKVGTGGGKGLKFSCDEIVMVLCSERGQSVHNGNNDLAL